MIRNQTINQNRKYKQNARIKSLVPWLIFIFSFIINYYLEVDYSGEIQLFNDKIIDVSALFFGVFVGSLYLFDKFNERVFYSNLIKFSKKLIILNVILIILSFLIILYHQSFSIKGVIVLGANIISLNYSLIVFSIYVSTSAVTIYFMMEYIKVLFLLINPSKKK